MPQIPLFMLGVGLDLLEKWKEVVDEATAMRKLKSILVYRRKAADMRERAKENSGEHHHLFVSLTRCARRTKHF